MRAAGTLMIGKTTTPEFGLPCYTEPDIAPPARSPWDVSRSAGGSSGGAAAAVAAHIAPVAHASDGGGSIRIPASACGLVGLKPTRGRVSPGPLGSTGPGWAFPACSPATSATRPRCSRPARGWPAICNVLAVGDDVSRFVRSGPGPAPRRVLTPPVIAEQARVDQACIDAVGQTAALLRTWATSWWMPLSPSPRVAGHPSKQSGRLLARRAPIPPPRASAGSVYEMAACQRSGFLRARVRRCLLRSAAATRGLRVRGNSFDVILFAHIARLPVLVANCATTTTRRQTSPVRWNTRVASVWNLTAGLRSACRCTRVDVDGTMLPVGVMLGGRQGQRRRVGRLRAVGASHAVARGVSWRWQMQSNGRELHVRLLPGPNAADPLLETAREVEHLGLEFVADRPPLQAQFCRHPRIDVGHPATTSSLRVFPDFANLPVRPPAVRAKAAANPGRAIRWPVRAGARAGGFWDAIDGYGGVRPPPRRSRRPACRGRRGDRRIWTVNRQPRFEGATYHLRGVHSGPAARRTTSEYGSGIRPPIPAATGRSRTAGCCRFGGADDLGRLTHERIPASTRARTRVGGSSQRFGGSSM